MSSQATLSDPSRANLRLFRPQATSARGLSPEMTLSEFFAAFVLPLYLRAKNRDAKTIAEYETAIARWAELTRDPPLAQIDQATCAAFVVADLGTESAKHKGSPLSPNTVRKHCTHLQMVLDLAGPLSRERPEAATDEGLFGLTPRGMPRKAPWFVKPDARDKPPEDCFTLEEMGAWLDACKHATRPILPDCSATCWWRALLIFLYNCDLRIGSTIAMRRSWISPVGDDEGMLNVPGEFYKGGRPHQFYLSPDAMAGLRSVPTTDYVFPWPYSETHLDRVRRKLQEVAGFAPARQFGFHAIRKCGLSELSILSLEVAQQQAGHGSMQTTINSYVRPSARGQIMANRLGPTFRKLPQPKRQQSPQRLLFD